MYFIKRRGGSQAPSTGIVVLLHNNCRIELEIFDLYTTRQYNPRTHIPFDMGGHYNMTPYYMCRVQSTVVTKWT